MRRIGYAIIAVLAVEIVVVWFLSYRTTIHLTAMNGSRLVFEFHADDGSFSIANASSKLRNTSLLLSLLIVLLWPLVEAALVLKRFLPKKPKAVKTKVTPTAEEAPVTPAAKSPTPASPSTVTAASAPAKAANAPSAATAATVVKSSAPVATELRQRSATPQAATSRPAAPATSAVPARPASAAQAEHK